MCETTTILPRVEIEPKVQSLGIYTVDFGIAGDPDRIKKMVHKDNHVFSKNYLDDNLDPNRFVGNGVGYPKGIDNWPVGIDRVELFTVCFGEKILDRRAAVLEKFPKLFDRHTDLLLASFPQLVTQFGDVQMLELKKRGISHLAVIDDDSLRLDSNGRKCNTFIFSDDWYCGLSSHRINEPYDEVTHFLLYRRLWR